MGDNQPLVSGHRTGQAGWHDPGYVFRCIPRWKHAPPAETQIKLEKAARCSLSRQLLECSAMNSMQSHARGDAALLELNRRFYDPLWTDARLVEPQRFNTWPLVCSLVSPSQPRLEVGPGLRPRLPLDETHFVDFSPRAVAKLCARGANAIVALVSALPFLDRAFELVCAFDIIEHVDDEDAILSELSRVAAPNASLLLSVPLHPVHGRRSTISSGTAAAMSRSGCSPSRRAWIFR